MTSRSRRLTESEIQKFIDELDDSEIDGCENDSLISTDDSLELTSESETSEEEDASDIEFIQPRLNGAVSLDLSHVENNNTSNIVVTGVNVITSPIIKPDVVLEYNKTMGGVDTLSRVSISYSIQRRGLKWFRKIGELLIDFCIYNSFVIWKKLNKSSTSQLKFRQSLVKTILMYHLNKQAPIQPGRGEPVNYFNNPLRLIERHFITQKNQSLGRKRSKCVCCLKIGKRKETSYECRMCAVALRVTPCFEIYHTQRDITSSRDSSSCDSEQS